MKTALHNYPPSSVTISGAPTLTDSHFYIDTIDILKYARNTTQTKQ